ncbi:hypothetical protein NDA11_002064 [Ustilago hordei]|nr:hypothetical protein NDA10_005059 [Ustilago hordei]KAJ1572639.1 hypothetical protein NDA11_002064 [Ustilago hordei]KAJ1591331.1 hypothetical protein NDA15_007314 [Ustilago hordei]KAJ1593408.1 hypothetical protein NDA12_007298 [Ustilago hordei]KAJ1603598.1 hypothetical protein NDA14_006824 [Ustilago hordei]
MASCLRDVAVFDWDAATTCSIGSLGTSAGLFPHWISSSPSFESQPQTLQSNLTTNLASPSCNLPSMSAHPADSATLTPSAGDVAATPDASGSASSTSTSADNILLPGSSSSSNGSTSDTRSSPHTSHHPCSSSSDSPTISPSVKKELADTRRQKDRRKNFNASFATLRELAECPKALCRQTGVDFIIKKWSEQRRHIERLQQDLAQATSSRHQAAHPSSTLGDRDQNSNPHVLAAILTERAVRTLIRRLVEGYVLPVLPDAKVESLDDVFGAMDEVYNMVEKLELECDALCVSLQSDKVSLESELDEVRNQNAFLRRRIAQLTSSRPQPSLPSLDTHTRIRNQHKQPQTVHHHESLATHSHHYRPSLLLASTRMPDSCNLRKIDADNGSSDSRKALQDSTNTLVCKRPRLATDANAAVRSEAGPPLLLRDGANVGGVGGSIPSQRAHANLVDWSAPSLAPISDSVAPRHAPMQDARRLRSLLAGKRFGSH